MENTGRSRGFIALVLGLMALLALTCWWPRDDVLVTAPSPAAPAPAEPPQPVVAELASTATERTTAPEPPPSPPAVDPLLAHVRGRCVDEQGAPLAGCTAKFDAWGGNSNRMAMQGKVDWHDPEPIVTSADGRFDFAFAPPSGMQFSLDVKADGRVPRTGRWGQLAPAQIVDLGDIVFGRGFEVRGRVVDEQGVPVPKVGVMLQNLPLPIVPNMGANDVRYGFSDAAGDFRVEVPIPIGTWSLDAQANGVRLVSPDHVTVTDRGADPVLVTVRHMPRIEGLVVDELGQPVQGVEVRAALARSGRMASGRSRKDGTFTIHAVDAEPKPVQLQIDDPGPCEPPAKPDERLYEWGTKDVRIELHRATTCELVVVERATGAPVTQFAVSCASIRARSSRQTDLRLSGEHPDGRVTIDRVWRGKNTLQVMPLDPALLPSAKVEFEATDAGAPPQRIELDRLAAATVRVTTANGAPVVGSKVEIIAKGTRPFTVDARAQDSRSGNRGWSSDPKYRAHELVSSAVSGVDGRAVVFVPSSPEGLVVRATGAHPPALVDPAQFVPGLELTVVAPAAGSIIGVVRVQGLDPSRIRISCNPREPTAQANHQPTPVQSDGTFALHGLLPGRYQLQLSYQVPFRTEHGGSTGAVALDVPAADVAVEADRETKVAIDASTIGPATVHGRALLDGAPPPAARIFLQPARGAPYGQFVVAADGTFTAPDLLPGTYRIHLVVGDFQAGPGDTIPSAEPFELTAGQQLTRDFVFVRRRLVITLLQADGKTPAANVTCMLNGDQAMLRDQTTDQDGRLVVDPAPASAFYVQPRNARQALGPVQLPEGQSSGAVTLQLPAPDAPK